LFCIKVIVLEHTLPLSERDSYYEEQIEDTEKDPLVVFKDVRNRYLVLDEATPFDHLQRLLQYAKHVGKGMTGKEKITWSKDKSAMYFNGQELEIDRFKDFVRQLISKCHSQLAELLFGLEKDIEDIALENWIDDLNLANVGYSFVKDPKNVLYGGAKRMMDRAKRQGKLSEIMAIDQTSVANVSFCANGVNKYLAKVNSFLETLLLVIHLTGGQPARGTEILSIRYVVNRSMY
jgi:hypothetical protein